MDTIKGLAELLSTPTGILLVFAIAFLVSGIIAIVAGDLEDED